MESCSNATHCSRSFHRTSGRGLVFRKISHCWTEDASLDFVAHLFQFPALEGLWLCMVSFIQLYTFNRNKRKHTVMWLPWPGLLKSTAQRITDPHKTVTKLPRMKVIFCSCCELGTCISCFLLLYKEHDTNLFFYVPLLSCAMVKKNGPRPKFK